MTAEIFFKPLRDMNRWALWSPAAIALGVLIYFALDTEPSSNHIYLSLAGALASFFLALRLRRIVVLRLLCLGVMWVLLGFAAGMMRTTQAGHVVLAEKLPPVMAHGTIERLEDRGDSGLRLILTDVDLWKIPSTQTPRKIRITIRGETPALMAGDRIAIRVVLSPPPRPVFPGGYDFARMAYFERIGAVGFAINKPKILEKNTGITHWLQAHRQHITERIYHALEQDHSATVTGIAAALITGESGRIEDEDLASMRASGLSHILSISGLHMVLASSILFVGARMFLALFPFIVLHYPIKKWAAAAAIIASFYYLLIAGMPVSAERAYLMIFLFFVAILLDRINTPMRPIALAAGLLLLLRPESILNPSFQMSFAAVIALCAYFQEPPEAPIRAFHPLYKIWHHLTSVAMASVIAGTATAPFAFYHFGQYAVYGLVANMLAVPLSSFIIMPAGVLALILLPVGLEQWPLELMAQGIRLMMWVSDATVALPFSTLNLPHMDTLPLLLIVAGGLWICLWAQRLRWLGLAPVLLGVGLYLAQTIPDVVLEERGKLFAIRDAEYGMAVPSRTYARYAREYWTKALGVERMVRFSELPSNHPLSTCTARSCAWEIDGVRFYRGNECRAAEVLILTEPQECAGALLTITPRDLARNGTHALWVSGGKVRAESVEPLRGSRGWTSH